ncbi:MAG: RNA polymerase sigma factor [Deltaproteobacteria bacterium]|nr:RNA polymerase sigma factor [Deltaproteobacteria bacterium]
MKLREDNYRRLRKWRRLGKFSSFLAIVVHNLARDHLRSERQRTGKDPPSGSPEPQDLPGSEKDDPAHVALLREVQRAVRGARDKLEPIDRELLRLKYDRDWSYKEIATEMGLTVNQVGVYLYRAEKRLREILYEKFPDLFPNNEEHV